MKLIANKEAINKLDEHIHFLINRVLDNDAINKFDEHIHKLFLRLDNPPPEPPDYSKEYLTIESLEDSNTISFKRGGSSATRTISISTDGGQTWLEKTSTADGTLLTTLNTGEKLLLKGNNESYGTFYYSVLYNTFVSTKKFNVYGNIMSLIGKDSFDEIDTLSKEYTFYGLFNGCTGLISANNLVLPATTLAQSCYSNMFKDCTSLITTPKLPATTLVSSCYSNMFYGCTSLTTAPELPATILELSCYQAMFYGCTSLITTPKLPATDLANTCYSYMFRDCTSLTTAPELPATTLANYCYRFMFFGCIRLTTAPVLPATTLANYCYEGMFQGCTRLNYIKCLATDISTQNCTTDWVRNVSSTGTFVRPASMTSWTTGFDGIPSEWTVENAND